MRRQWIATGIRGVVWLAGPLRGSGISEWPGVRHLWLRACRGLIPADGLVHANGHAFEVHASDSGGISGLLLDGVFEPEETTFIEKTVPSGAVVADVGANIGMHTMTLARCVGPTGVVYAFEPEPDNVALLRRNVERNGYADRVRIVPVAVSDTPGESRLDLHPTSRSGHRLRDPGGTRRLPGAETVAVTTVTLDGYFAGEPAAPTFIKIDVEGLEDRVLRGATDMLRSDATTILVEYWAEGTTLAGPDADNVPPAMRAAGFEPVTLNTFRTGRCNVAWSRAAAALGPVNRVARAR